MVVTVYGIHSVKEELISGRRRPAGLFLGCGELSSRQEELRDLAEKHRVPVHQVSRAELDTLTQSGQHQGVALQLEGFSFVPLDDLLEEPFLPAGGQAFFLILDSISDPRNFGAMVRSAEAAGCHGVIIAKDRSCPVTGVVHKASAGALAHVPVCRVTNIANTIRRLKDEGIWVFGLGAEGGQALYDEDLRGPLALVVGCEGKGLRPNVRKQCDAVLAIPMIGRVSSLNASVAASLALFDVVRQRREAMPREDV